MASLPTEIINKISEKLDINSILELSVCSKTLRENILSTNYKQIKTALFESGIYNCLEKDDIEGFKWALEMFNNEFIAKK